MQARHLRLLLGIGHLLLLHGFNVHLVTDASLWTETCHPRTVFDNTDDSRQSGQGQNMKVKMMANSLGNRTETHVEGRAATTHEGSRLTHRSIQWWKEGNDQGNGFGGIALLSVQCPRLHAVAQRCQHGNMKDKSWKMQT